MSDVYSKSQVEQIKRDYDFWLLWEHDNWKLISFTDRISARFGWDHLGQFTKYVEVKVPEVRFLKEIPPDVLDQL